MFFPSHPSPPPLTLSSQVEYCLCIGDFIIVDYILFLFFCFVLLCLYVCLVFFLRGRGGEGREGSGKNDWVVHIAFLVLILADGGGWQALK